MANQINQTRRLAGIASITIDGTAYDLVGELMYSTSTRTRTTLVGQDGIHGYSEMPVAGHMSFMLRDNGGFSVQGFNQITSSSIQAFLANGKGVVASGAWCVETQEVNSVDSTFHVRFESDNLIEVLAR